MASKSLFKEIDSAIDKQIEEVRSSNFFQNISDQLRSFTENEQKFLNQFLSALLLLIPIILLISVFIYRTIQRSDLTDRQVLQQAIVDFKEGNVQLKTQEGAIVNTITVYEKEDFAKLLDDSLSRLNLKTAQVKADGFQKVNLGGSINKIETNIIIDKLTNKAFVGLLNQLHSRFKVIVTEIDLERTKETKFVSGKLAIEFYSKVN